MFQLIIGAGLIKITLFGLYGIMEREEAIGDQQVPDIIVFKKVGGG